MNVFFSFFLSCFCFLLFLFICLSFVLFLCSKTQLLREVHKSKSRFLWTNKLCTLSVHKIWRHTENSYRKLFLNTVVDNLLLIVKSAFHFNFISFFRKQIPRFRIHISFVYFLLLFIYILHVNSGLCGRANKQNKILSKCIHKIFINIAWYFFRSFYRKRVIWLMFQFNYKTKQMFFCACVWR